ncbi:MAG: sulfite exporter TauE/SafE family protein [Oscillospiraceae bacterium]|jgi:sulfite exporter TauE/SafE/copper chaperone CopZ|nr:sulfite exporter TauE/SafE family protein [Oscillospiraceae bacterium]
MAQQPGSAHFRIGGMTCAACQTRIERALRAAPGVRSASVRYGENAADVDFDPDLISRKEIISIIETLHYDVLPDQRSPRRTAGRAAGLLILVAALFFPLQYFGLLNYLVPGRLAQSGMGYGMLFLIGLVTSVHCVAMCGGLHLSQYIPADGSAAAEPSGKPAVFFPALVYHSGRLISYTGIGGALGLVGWLMGGGHAEVGVPLLLQGVLKLAAGVFMVLMGVNMLGIFRGRFGSFLRTLQPHLPKQFAGKISRKKARVRSPFVVGLLNGLMPCGPLQAMQIVALASGNPLKGAVSMFLFCLGTVPLLLGLGSLVSALGKKFTRNVLTAGAVLVTVLGLAMFVQGWNLTGFLPLSGRIAAPSAQGGAAEHAENSVTIENGVQVVRSTLSPRAYPNITVQAGIPVRWIIGAPPGSVTACNAQLNIRPLGISGFALETGENIMEFTPAQPGVFRYSCWMGMISGVITVTDARGGAPSLPAEEPSETAAVAAPASGGSCCG